MAVLTFFLVETVPRARTLSPLQTSAKEVALTSCSSKPVVLASTRTVYGVPREVKVKDPSDLAVPQAPAMFEPLTEATVPDARCCVRTPTVVAAAAPAREGYDHCRSRNQPLYRQP